MSPAPAAPPGAIPAAGGGPVVWLDGSLRPLEAARVSPADRGFLYGDGLFETLRAYGGRPFRPKAHLDRLLAGCAALGIPAPARGGLAEAMGAVLEANGLDADAGAGAGDARIRITVTRGAGGGDLVPDPAVAGPPTVLVTAAPYQADPAWYARGVAAITSRRARVVAGEAAWKSTSYQGHVLAKAEARGAGAWEALLGNDRGEVAEGATSNVFALGADGVLVTPPAEAGILPGITRAEVLALAKPALCLDAAEAPLSWSGLAEAREAFLTTSLAEVVPLVRLDGRAVGDGAPGPVTRAVLEAYRAEVERSCGNGKSKRSAVVK